MGSTALTYYNTAYLPYLFSTFTVNGVNRTVGSDGIYASAFISSVNATWGYYNIGGTLYTNPIANSTIQVVVKGHTLQYQMPTNGTSTGWSAGYVATLPRISSDVKLGASSFFSSSNPTTRTVSVTATTSYRWVSVYNYDGTMGRSIGNSGTTETITLGTVTLDAPPTYKVTDSGGTETTQVYFDTPYTYAGLTTASVKVANLSAKYGGNISSATLKIGNQTVSRADSGELSILLDTGGTFIPTVTVTDSRGQTATKALDPITVNVYDAPSVTFDTERTTSTGTPDDEGTYAVINPTFTFTDVIATLTEPTVTVTDNDGITTTVTPTWYSSRAQDGTLSGTVTWANLSSGGTVYGLISGFNTQYSYQISVTPEDSEGTGTTQTQTLGGAYYTVDFLAGGHGIAFGKPASNVGFECAMDTLLEATITFDDEMFISLTNYQTADTTDKAIYDAIVALGWDTDVLIP